MPEVLFAGSDGHDGVCAMVDNKGQRVGTGAAVGVGIVECIYAGSSIGCAIPRIVVADSFGIAVVGSGIDGKIKRIYIGATRAWLRMVISINTRGSIFRSVPYVLVASSNMIGCIVVDADIQMQRIGTGAAVSISIVVSIDARDSVCGAIPCVAVASCSGIAIVAAVVDCQVKGDDAVTADGIEN